MGRYYALADGEAAEVAEAIARALPAARRRRRPAADAPAASRWRIADKLDTLAGIFAIGQKPTGTRDPFGLRRAAIGVLRIVLEKRLELDLRRADRAAVRAQPVAEVAADAGGAVSAERARPSCMERLRAQYLERPRPPASAPRCSMRCWRRSRPRRSTSTRASGAGGVPQERRRRQPHGREQAQRQHPEEVGDPVRCAASTPSCCARPPSSALHARSKTCARPARRRWRGATTRRRFELLATLRPKVDAFFDQVLVNDSDAALRGNRLALLGSVARSVHAHRRSVAPAGLKQCSYWVRCCSPASSCSVDLLLRDLLRAGLRSAAVPRPLRARARLPRSVLIVLRWTCGLDYRVEGRENLPAGNHIALIKHASSWETVAQMVLLPPQVWVLKRELIWLPAFGWALMLLRSIAVDRGAGGSAVKSVLEQGKAAARGGQVGRDLSGGHAHAAGRDAPLRRQRRAARRRERPARSCRWRTMPAISGRGAGSSRSPARFASSSARRSDAAGREPRDVNAEAQDWIERHSRH